jgi:hypothetical protein
MPLVLSAGQSLLRRVTLKVAMAASHISSNHLCQHHQKGTHQCAVVQGPASFTTAMAPHPQAQTLTLPPLHRWCATSFLMHPQPQVPGTRTRKRLLSLSACLVHYVITSMYIPYLLKLAPDTRPRLPGMVYYSVTLLALCSSIARQTLVYSKYPCRELNPRLAQPL